MNQVITHRQWPRLVVLAGSVLLTATGCGVHFDTGEALLPTLSAEQQSREYAADLQQALLAATEEVSTDADSEDAKAVWSNLAGNAQARLDALGGVWQPWETASADTEAPLPEPKRPVISARSDAVVFGLQRCYNQCWADAQQAPDDDTARLMAAIALGCRADLHLLYNKLGVEQAQVTAEESASAPVAAEDEPTYLDREAELVGPVLLAVDSAQYSLSRLAAANPEEYGDAHSGIGLEWERLTDRLAALGAVDKRRVIYPPVPGLEGFEGDQARFLALHKQVFEAEFHLIGSLDRPSLRLRQQLVNSFDYLTAHGVKLGALPGLDS